MIKYSRGLAKTLESAQTIEQNKFCELLSTVDDCYEYIPDDRPIKLYFDIDVKGDADKYDNELNMTKRIIEIAKTGVNEFAKTIFPDIVPEYCVCTSNSTRFKDWKTKKELWKVSVHVVVNNIIALKSVQNNLVKAMNEFLLLYKEVESDGATFYFIDDLEGIFDEKKPKFFDESPYDKNRKLRCVGSSKPGENRPLILLEGTIEQSIISGFIPDNAVEYVIEPSNNTTTNNKTGKVENIPTNSDHDYKKVEEFINEGIFDDRAKAYKSWVDMGFALYNGFGETSGWDLFELFSQRCSEKYDEFKNREFWDKLAASIQPENCLKLASIMKWARDDNKDEYTRICDKYKKQRARQAQKEEKEKSEADDPNFYKNVFAKKAPEFEKNHIKIIDRGIYIKEFPDHVILLSPEKLKAAYSHIGCGVNSKGVTQKFIDHWMNANDNIRKADNMDIFPDPTKNIHNYYNLWRPFAIDLFEGSYTKNEEGKQALLDHILVLCDYEEPVYNYILLWIAHMLQYPAKKSIVPTLISLQGSGKGTLMKLLARLIGENRVFESGSPERDVWGNFNGLMPEKFLVNLNELSRKQTIESEGKIKALITDPRLIINPKGVAQYEINSYHRFIITTNNEHPVNTSQDDRRNLIIRCSDDKKGNADYFIKLNKYLEDDNVIRTIGEYFKTIEVKENFNEYPIPRTKYQDDLKEASRPLHELWLAGFAMKYKDERTVSLFPSEVWADFSEWCGQNNFMIDGLNSTKLGIRLNNLFKPKERSKYIETEQNGARKKTFYIQALNKYFDELQK